ncbi:MAG TPA: 3-methyl-2-oxobutanoate dehydrogenase subunit beta [Anaerolineae bacterium]|nr:3-methyl-2-oxobutanoate dehydrogenase subunit beta [Anaerolineae bacterium]
MSYDIEERELMYSGHVACPGCGAPMAMRYALKALGENTVLIIPASCWSIIAGPFPYSAVKVPLMHTLFETGGSAAAGVKAGLEARGLKDTTVLTWAGDGGTFDIGLQSLSGAVERNDDFIYVCYDNEAYMNTGIQRSSATPWGAWTTTTPVSHPKEKPKKDIMAIMAAHRIPYAATATVAYPEDFTRKLRKAKDIRGAKFFHVLAPCPSGWKSEPAHSVLISRLAVQARVFPLYEIDNGEQYTINAWPKEHVPVKEYLRLQGRFAHLKEADIAQIQGNVDWEWDKLVAKAMASGQEIPEQLD